MFVEQKKMLNIEYKKASERWCALIISLHETFIEYLWKAVWAKMREGKRLGKKSCELSKFRPSSAKSFNLMKIKMSCTMNKFPFSPSPR
jgi:hypothetical protein